MKQTTGEKGRIAEDMALAYLQERGLVPLVRNYRSPRGEIDLVMKDDDTTVFVEVRARTKNNILHPVETIDQHKIRKIVLTSQHYLQKHHKNSSRYYRYDIICISGPVENANIEWIKNAFDA